MKNKPGPTTKRTGLELFHQRPTLGTKMIGDVRIKKGKWDTDVLIKADKALNGRVSLARDPMDGSWLIFFLDIKDKKGKKLIANKRTQETFRCRIGTRIFGKNPPPDGEFVMGSPFKYGEYDMCTLTPTNNTK